MSTRLTLFNKFIKNKYDNVDDAIEIVDKLETDLINNYILYHKSFEEYCLDKEPCLKRKSVYAWYWILSFMLMLYMSILLLYNDELSLKAFGIPILIEMKVRRLTILLLFLLSAVFFLGKSLNFYLEMKNMIYMLNIFRYWSNHLNFQLRNPLAENLAMHINISFRWVSSI